MQKNSVERNKHVIQYNTRVMHRNWELPLPDELSSASTGLQDVTLALDESGLWAVYPTGIDNYIKIDKINVDHAKGTIQVSSY